MRYDTPVYFQLITAGEYDQYTGNYADDIITETKRFANITDAGSNTLNLLYGELKEGSLVVRIQQPYKEPFNRIRISDKVYRADFSRKKKVFIVSEVQ